MTHPTSASEGGPTCRCGHGIGHYMVSAEPEYGIAWLAVLVGISATPREVKYRCRRCDSVLLQTTDPAVLKAHS